MNRMNMIGRLVTDIELRYTPSGLASVRTTVAVNRKLSREKKEQAIKENKPTADFLRVVLLGKRAEFAGKYLKKGDLVSVEGSVRTGHYDTADGQRIFTTEVLCEEIQILASKKKTESPEEPSNEHSFLDAEDFEIEEIPF